jgi:hypothetical protein
MPLWTTTELAMLPYFPDNEPMEVPLVDAAVRYDRDGRVYILLIRNALRLLEYNLLPPFMMRETGVIVRDTPKIQLDDPSEWDSMLSSVVESLALRARRHGFDSV